MSWRRRALSQTGGRIESKGDPELSRVLADALVASDGGATDDLTHGFHAYPARMHPVLARGLIAAFSEPGDVVLDPFAGSGTVLIEAMVAGARAQGVDLSPLALRVAELQCALKSEAARAKFERAVANVAKASEARVRARAAVEVPISRTERAFYEPHVMLELSGLWDEIQKAPVSERRMLEMVFSALVVKFSRQRADTSEVEQPKRIRKGLVTEFFVRKGGELTQRWEALWDAMPEDGDRARFVQGDARELRAVLGDRFRADFVLTSPPYGGTYDYADHHARRTAWLGLDVRSLRAAEIGARRNLSAKRDALRRWDREIAAVLASIRDVVRREARVVLWLGDAEIDEVRVAADQQIARLSEPAGLRLVASAAQERQDMRGRGGAPRREHLLLLHPI